MCVCVCKEMNVIPGEKTIDVILTVCTATHYVVVFFLDAMFTKSNTFSGAALQFPARSIHVRAVQPARPVRQV